jgi:hypothetical protein
MLFAIRDVRHGHPLELVHRYMIAFEEPPHGHEP